MFILTSLKLFRAKNKCWYLAVTQTELDISYEPVFFSSMAPFIHFFIRFKRNVEHVSELNVIISSWYDGS